MQPCCWLPPAAAGCCRLLGGLRLAGGGGCLLTLAAPVSCVAPFDRSQMRCGGTTVAPRCSRPTSTARAPARSEAAGRGGVLGAVANAGPAARRTPPLPLVGVMPQRAWVVGLWWCAWSPTRLGSFMRILLLHSAAAAGPWATRPGTAWSGRAPRAPSGPTRTSRRTRRWAGVWFGQDTHPGHFYTRFQCVLNGVSGVELSSSNVAGRWHSGPNSAGDRLLLLCCHACKPRQQ